MAPTPEVWEIGRMSPLERNRWSNSPKVPTVSRLVWQDRRPHAQYESLIRACRSIPPIKTTVVHPCDASSLEAAIAAAIGKLIAPVLVGPEPRIREVAAKLGVDITNLELINAPHSHAAAALAVGLARSGIVGALM